MATNIVFKITGDAKGVTQELDSAGKAAGKANKEVTALQGSLNKIGASLAAYFTVSQIISFGQQVIKLTAQFDGFNKQLEFLGKDRGGSASQIAYITMLSEKLGLEIISTTEAYIKFGIASTQAGLSISKTQKIFTSVSEAVTAMHLPAEKAQAVFNALQQMISKGTVSSEELRQQLGDALPGSMSLAAKATGKTEQEFNKLLNTGKIISSEFLPKFAEQLHETFGEQSAVASNSLPAALNRLSTAWTNFILNLQQSGTIKSSIELLEKLLTVAENAVIGFKYLSATIRGNTKDFAELEAFLAGKGIKEYTLKQAELASKELEAYLKKNKESKNLESQLINEAASYQILINERRNSVKDQKDLTEEDNKYIITLNEKAKAFMNAADSMKTGAKTTINLTKEEQSQIEKLTKEIEDLTYQVQLFNAGGMETAKGLDVFEEHALKLLRASKAFKASNDEIKQGAEQIIISDVAEKKLQLQIKANSELSESQRKLAEQNAKDSADIDKFNDELLSKEDLKIQRKYELLSATASSSMQQLQIERKRLDEELKLYEKNAEKKAEINQKIKLNEINQDNLAKAQKEQNQQAIIQMIGQAAMAATSLIGRGLDKQQNDLEKQKQRGLITEREYERRLNDINRRKFNADKAANIARIIINTAMAESQYIGGLPATLPLMILAGALGAGELAIAASARNPYFHGTKSLPGSDYSKDSIPILAAPGERIVPNYINRDASYSGLMDLVQDRRISPDMAKHLTNIAISGYAPSISSAPKFDYDQMGKSMAKYVPVSQFSIDRDGVAMISVRQGNEKRRLKSRL